MSNKNISVHIQYIYVEGVHFYVSADEVTLGLCVAHKDKKLAYDSMISTLVKLLKTNHNKTIVLNPSDDINEFSLTINIDT